MERTGFTRIVFLDKKFQEQSASTPDFDKTKITQKMVISGRITIHAR